MNDRIELLKAVEAALPERWRCYVANEYEWLNWSVPTGQFDRTFPDPGEYVESCELVLWDDMRSAKAIVAMIDVMEQHLGCGILCPQPDGGYEYEFWPYRAGIDDIKPWHDKCYEGETRAEAVAKAFVACFNDSESAGNPSRHRNDGSDLGIKRGAGQ